MVEDLKKQIIEEAKLLAEDKEPQLKPIYPDFILDTAEGLFVVFAEIVGEGVELKKIKEGVYYYKVGENAFFFPTDEVWKLLLNKKFMSFAILPYLQDESGNVVKSFAGVEVLRVEFSEEDKKLFRKILEEIEKEKIKKEAQRELIEKLRKLGLTGKDIEKALEEN